MTWAGWKGQGGEHGLHQAYKDEPYAVMEGLCLDNCPRETGAILIGKAL